MANINDLIPKLRRNPVTGKLEEEPVIIDDAFDPLFNRRAKATIQNKYGINPLFTPVYGYADFLDTVFAPKQEGKWGIMGPAMGILGGFGRTLDKAEDFLLGGLTEGVNSLNQVNPFSTAPTTPQNPIRNIFVEDQDYTGEKLFAAMANSMNRMAGGTVLDETDFEDTTWKPAALATELLTDPGIAGGIMSKAGAGNEILQQLSKEGTISSPVKQVGDILSSYDDIVTKAAWDVTAPGLRPAIKNHLHKLRQLLAVNSEKAMKNVPLKSYTDEILENPNKILDISDEDIVTNTYNSIQDMYKKAIDDSGIMSANPQEVATKLEFINEQLDKIDEIAAQSNVARDDEYFKLFDELRRSVDNAIAVLNNPKDYLNGTIVLKDVLDKSNFLLEDKHLAKLEIARNRQANKEITNLLNNTGISSGDPNTEAFRINSKLKDTSYEHKLTREYVDAHQDDMYMLVNKFWENVNDEDSINFIYGHKGYDVNIKDYSRDIYDTINSILDGTYFDEDWINNKASREMRKLIQEYVDSKGGHKVIFSTSKLYTANSELGRYAVNRIKKDLESIDLDGLKTFMQDKEKALQASDMSHKVYGDKIYKIDNFKKELTKELTEKDQYKFLASAQDFYNYLEYAKARYGYMGWKAESKIENLLKKLDTDISLGLYGYGTKLSDLNVEDITNNQLKNTVNSWNLLLNKYEDPWVDEFGNFRYDKYTTSKEFLRKHNIIDLMINPNETFDLATVMKNSPKYKGLENKTVAEINNDLQNLYYAAKYKLDNFSIKPTDASSYVANNKKFQKYISTYTGENPYITKSIDELLPYQQDFLRKMSKDFGIQNMSFKNLNYKIRNAAKKGEDYFKMATYGDFSKTGLKLSGNEIDSFLLNSTEPVQQINALNNAMTKVQRKTAEDILTTLNDADFSKYIFESANVNVDSFKDVLKEKVIQAGYDEKSTNDFFTLINKQLLEPTKISRGDYATLRNKDVQKILSDLQGVGQKYGVYTDDWDILTKQEQVKRLKDYYKHTEMYFAYRDALNDDIVTKNSFLNELLSSRGMIAGVFNKNENLADFQAAERALIHNISIVNKQFSEKMPLLKLVEREVGDGKVVLGYAFNHKNLNAVKDFAKLKINPDNLQDVIFSRANQVRADEIKAAFDVSGAKFTFDDLDDIFNRSQNISRDLSRKIGYTDFSDNYFRHSMSSNKNAEKWLSSYVYAVYNSNDLADLSTAIMNYQNLGHGKAYGILPVTRSLRGSIETWNNLSPGTYIFSVDPYTVAKKTYSEGIFNNANFQTHVGLFTNDNFRISNYARSVQDLKDILFVKVNGELTGNMDNMVLAAPKYSKEGRIIGFTQFDKFTDEGLQQALDNPETVLLPTHLMAPLDKMLRKDMKMSSKVYQFINKYFTIPIKYGTLTNLGFLVGNMGDAYFKQAVTMSRKYGTSVPYEMARVAESIKNVFVLGNKFENTFEKYVSDMKLAMGEDKWIKFYSTTDSLISTPKARNNFEDWLKKSLASGRISRNEMDVSNLWLFLNNKENTSIFKGDFQNLGDLAKSTSKYAPPKNLAERLLTGDKVMVNPDEVKEYWGLFAGNPVTEGILEASGNIESIARSASILNDLTRHYGSKDIYKILGNADVMEKEFKELNIKALDALNVMSTANFDYNYMNDLTDRFATFVPFPTFVVKNYAYWMDIMVNEPELIDSILTMQNVAWRGKNTENDKFQAEAKGRGAIPLSTSKNSKLKGIFKPTPTQSMFSAFDVMQNPIQNAAFRTNPVLHPLTHHLQKAEDDKYRPYSTDPYQKNIKRTDKEYSALAATFHRLNPYERTVNTWLRTPSKLFSEHNAQISDFVPSVFQPDFSTKSNTKNKKR